MKGKKSESPIKFLFGRIHLWGGLLSGIIVLIVSLTGCIFVFEKEIRDYTQREYRFVAVRDRPRVSLSEVEHNLQREFPGMKIEQLKWFEDPSAAIVAKLTPNPLAKTKRSGKHSKQTYFIDPYSGKLLSRTDFERDFMHYVEEMHKTLLLGDFGKWIIKVNIVVFLCMLISGLYLWWPGKRNQRKQAFKPRFSGKFQAVNYSLHNTLGFYFLLPLLVITLTGIWWAVKPVQKLVYATLGDSKQKTGKVVSMPVQGKVFRPETAFDQVRDLYPGWNEAHLNFPKNDKDVVKINLRYPYSVYRKQNVFEFDQFSGGLLKAELYTDYTTADKIKHANRDLHTGQNYGLLGKMIAFLSSLFAATLPVTGFFIWYKRKYKPKSNVRESLPGRRSVSMNYPGTVLEKSGRKSNVVRPVKKRAVEV